MSEPVQISPVEEADLASITQLAREIWYLHYPGIITVKQIDYMVGQRYRPEVIRAQMANGEAWWDKLQAGTALAGFASYEPGSTAVSLKLDKLYVHPRYQGRGYGYALVRHVEEQGRRRGFKTLYLQVNKGNTRSIDFYRRAGFSTSNPVKVDIGQGFFMDDLVLSKTIPK